MRVYSRGFHTAYRVRCIKNAIPTGLGTRIKTMMRQSLRKMCFRKMKTNEQKLISRYTYKRAANKIFCFKLQIVNKGELMPNSQQQI